MKTQALKFRKHKLAQIAVAICLFFFTFQAQAQRISVNINVNSAPREVVYVEPTPNYYYYPEIEAYFDINSSVYIYFQGNSWVRSRYLPTHCSGYDVRHGQRVVLDYYGQRPYTHFHDHKKKYKCKPYKKQKKHHHKH